MPTLTLVSSLPSNDSVLLRADGLKAEVDAAEENEKDGLAGRDDDARAAGNLDVAVLIGAKDAIGLGGSAA